MDQFLTLKRAKIGPMFDLTAFIYIYIYIYMYIRCEVTIIWVKFGLLEGYYLGQVGVIIWAKFVFSLCLEWLQAIFVHTILILCFWTQLSGT